ncbi:MAG: F-box protein [Parachlamydiales bacterium]|nr:F-box protein [Parachlamydiales bacterium]
MSCLFSFWRRSTDHLPPVSPNPSTGLSIQDLPPEILWNILGRANPDICQRVCQEWNKIVQSHFYAYGQLKTFLEALPDSHPKKNKWRKQFQKLEENCSSEVSIVAQDNPWKKMIAKIFQGAVETLIRAQRESYLSRIEEERGLLWTRDKISEILKRAEFRTCSLNDIRLLLQTKIVSYSPMRSL